MFILLFIALTPCTVAGGSPDTTVNRRGTWSVLPIIFSSPDTRFGFGILPQYVFRTSQKTRASHARMDVYFTQEKQFNVTGRTGVWLPSDRYYIGGKVQLREWPTTFYGIGNTLGDSARERYTERSIEVTAELQRRIHSGIYAGARFELGHRSMKDREAGGMLFDGDIAGGDGGQVVGFGIVLSFDTRENTFYPTDGHIIRLGSDVYARVAGADFGFTQHSVDARRYVSLPGRQVVALQGTLHISTGTPPFQMLPGVGQVVRGYSSKRLTDRNMLAFQAEYRLVPLVWRFGLVAFVGVGQTLRSFDEFALNRFHIGYGAGIRFQIIRSEHVNVRWDFGFGANSSGDYLDLNEAF
jgi:outer membrane protein assembly factor BamA